MSDDKLDFFEFDSMFRFEFTASSLAWGATVGILLSCHKYSKTRLVKESIFFGSFFGFLTASGMWGYNLYKFTMSRHIIQQQNYSRQEAAQKLKFVENYFKIKYDLQDASSEQLALAISELDSKWNQLESQLSSEE